MGRPWAPAGPRGELMWRCGCANALLGRLIEACVRCGQPRPAPAEEETKGDEEDDDCCS